MPTVNQLRQQAKARKIKGYSKMSKSQLMSQLGVMEDHKEKARIQAKGITKKHGVAQTFATEALANKLAKSSPYYQTDHPASDIKEHLLSNLKRDLRKAQRQAGRILTKDEARKVAAQSLRKSADQVREMHGQKLPRASAGKAKPKAEQPKAEKPKVESGVNQAQMKTIAAHLKASKEGKTDTHLSRVLQDKNGQHWAEFTKGGRVAAVPMGKDGKLDRAGMKGGAAWEEHQKGATVLAGRGAKEANMTPPKAAESTKTAPKARRKSTKQKAETAPKTEPKARRKSTKQKAEPTPKAPTKARRKSSKVA